MNSLTVFKIKLITLFDSVCFGLIYPFLPPHLLTVAGNHTALGIYGSVCLVSQLLSNDLTQKFVSIHGRHKSLLINLSTAVISYLLIIVSTNAWIIILARSLYCLVNQVHLPCIQLLQKNVPKEKLEDNLTVIHILNSSGFIIGPVISGYLFDAGFSYICVLAAFLTLFNITLVLSIPKAEDDLPQSLTDQSITEKVLVEVRKTVEDCNKADYKSNWDLIIIKFLFTGCISVFFTKFSQILKHRFNTGSITIGYTASYMNGIIFAATYLIDKFRQMPAVDYTVQAFVVFTACIAFISYSYSYFSYLIICIPLIFSRNYINSIWKDLFASRKNESLNKLNNSIGIVAGVITNVLFGIARDGLGYNAIMLFTIVPSILSLLIVKIFSKLQVESDRNHDKNQ